MKHIINNENIERLDEISQEVSRWQVTQNSVSYTVTVLRCFKRDGETVYGGFFKCIDYPGGDACGDFYPNEAEALDNLLFRVLSHSLKRD